MSANTASLDASIIVCTYNRAASLRDTLRALRGLEASPDLRWEVVVVDNNSTDDTHSVVEEARRDWPRLRYEFEAEQGLSHARNRGIEVAHGKVILFTDDDVLPEPDWLEVTRAGMTAHQADACGGYIAPLWETPPPAWLTNRFHGFLAIRTEREDDYIISNYHDAPFGANMAFRREVFDTVGGFDTRRGRKGQSLFGGEDLELFERLIAAGMKAVFLGQSRVHHKVEAYRLNKEYFRRWRRQTSRNLALSKGVPGQRRLFNIPFYMYPQFGRAVLRAVHGHLFRAEDEALHRDMVVNHFLGTFQGLWEKRHRTET